MRSWSTAIMMCLIVVLASGSCLAGQYKEIDAIGVKSLIEQNAATVINPLSSIEYENQHIPGTINIPLDHLASRLPNDKNEPIVFYCLGLKCVFSWRAAEVAIDLGYQNVYAFRGGIPEWKEAGFPIESTLSLPDVTVPTVTTEELSAMVTADDIVLLDINCEEDANKFWIDTEKRVYIPLKDLQEKYTSIPKDKKVAILCLKGKRSPTAAKFLMKHGYNDVVIVEGGMQKWIMEGRPIKQAS